MVSTDSKSQFLTSIAGAPDKFRAEADTPTPE